MTNLIERLRSRAWEHRWHRKYRDEAAAEIERLQAQHDDDKSDLLAMQRERDALVNDVHSCHAGCTRAGCVNAGLREDAERYRWLRRSQVALSLPNSTVAALVADQSQLDIARSDE